MIFGSVVYGALGSSTPSWTWTNPATPNLADYQTFLYVMAQFPQANLPANSQIIIDTFNIALSTVNRSLSAAGLLPTPVATPTPYCMAIYNLGADRIINFAIDVTNQTYFKDLRTSLHILDTRLGVVASGSDQGTSMTLINPKQMMLFTLQDLQTLKTTFGREYMAIAQTYGRSLWGLT